jgi:hypothetical protein
MPAFAAAWMRRISSTFRFLNSSTSGTSARSGGRGAALVGGDSATGTRSARTSWARSRRCASQANGLPARGTWGSLFERQLLRLLAVDARLDLGNHPPALRLGEDWGPALACTSETPRLATAVHGDAQPEASVRAVLEGSDVDRSAHRTTAGRSLIFSCSRHAISRLAPYSSLPNWISRISRRRAQQLSEDSRRSSRRSKAAMASAITRASTVGAPGGLPEPQGAQLALMRVHPRATHS